jgi:hypothetical protein
MISSPFGPNLTKDLIKASLLCLSQKDEQATPIFQVPFRQHSSVPKLWTRMLAHVFMYLTPFIWDKALMMMMMTQLFSSVSRHLDSVDGMSAQNFQKNTKERKRKRKREQINVKKVASDAEFKVEKDLFNRFRT